MKSANHTHWIFLSPHFDDAALSCGGLIWEMTHAGDQVEIWTIMAGYPTSTQFSSFAQENHLAWGKSGKEAIQMRRAEDQQACQILNADFRYFEWPDAIYRRNPTNGLALVSDVHTLFNLEPEPAVVREITNTLQETLPDGVQVVMPMGLGRHIDHLAVAQAAQKSVKAPLYYADYPYILNHFDSPALLSGEFTPIPHQLNRAAVQAWQNAVLAYTSQLTGFWRDATEARLALSNYQAGGGGRLWKQAHARLFSHD